MRKLFLLGFFLFALPLFASNEELKQLYQLAETALNKKDYSAAKEAYESLILKVNLKKRPEQSAEWAAYIDIITRCSQLNEILGDWERSELLITRLLDKNPPSEYLPQLASLKARFLCKRNLPEEAYILLSQTTHKIPLEKWHKQYLPFYDALAFMLDAHFDSIMQRADQLKMASLYDEAIGLFQTVLEAIDLNHYPKCSITETKTFLEKKIRYQLAESYLKKLYYQKAIETPNDKNSLIVEMVPLLGSFHKAKREYEKEIDCLKRYLGGKPRADLKNYDEAICELGIIYHKNGNEIKAKRYFASLLETDLDRFEKAHFLAALYSAKILMKENECDKSLLLLETLKPHLNKKEELYGDFTFLMGEAELCLNKPELAIALYEQALTSKKSTQWKNYPRFQLAQAYLQLTKDPTQSNAPKTDFFEKAEKLFLFLIQSSDEQTLKEKSLLYLCSLYEREGFVQKIPILLDSLPSLSDEALFHSYLLKGKYDSTYQKRDEWLQKGSSPLFEHFPFFSHCWYQRGLNQLEEALKQFNSIYLEKAIFCFQRSFELQKESKTIEAFEKSQGLAPTHFYQKETCILENAYIILNSLIKDCFQKVDDKEKEELLLFKAIIAAELASQGKEEYYNCAEQVCDQLQAFSPIGANHAELLKILGALFYRHGDFVKADFYYSQIIEHHPQSPLVPSAFFWLAQAKQQQGLSCEEIAILRKKNYIENPHSDYALEGYFQIFSIKNYFELNKDALEHLKEFSESCPSSVFSIIANYCLGISEQNAHRFEKAISLYEELSHNHKLVAISFPEPDFSNKLQEIYFSSQYELAVLLKENNFLLSKQILENLNQKLPGQSHYTSLLENIQYELALINLKLGEENKAQVLFQKILQLNANCGITHSAILTNIWMVEAESSMSHNDFLSALQSFQLAEDSFEPSVNEEELLQVWIGQSLCLKELKKYDQALQLLSKVISEKPFSSLCIKAMFLRAEIYELQGYLERAFQQLDEIQQIGGDWATKAQEKIKSLRFKSCRPWEL